MNDQPFLEMRGISKSFSGTRVLSNVDFSLRAGEVRALMGENGAGKSTLIKILGGIYTRDEGEILIDGKEASISSIADALMGYGISIIHQEIILANNMTVAENLFMNREPSRFKNSFVNFRKLNTDAGKLLADMGLSIAPTDKVGSLSIAKQ